MDIIWEYVSHSVSARVSDRIVIWRWSDNKWEVDAENTHGSSDR